MPTCFVSGKCFHRNVGVYISTDICSYRTILSWIKRIENGRILKWKIYLFFCISTEPKLSHTLILTLMSSQDNPSTIIVWLWLLVLAE